MKIAESIIIFIYILLLTILSLGVILIALRLIPLDLVWTNIAKIEGNLEIGLVGAVFFLAGIGFLLKNIFTKRRGEAIVQHNELGDIKISLTALEDLIEKVTQSVSVVKNVKATAFMSGDDSKKILTATIKAAISPEESIPKVTADIQNRVRLQVKETVGIDLEGIEVVVEAISGNFKARHKVR